MDKLFNPSPELRSYIDKRKKEREANIRGMPNCNVAIYLDIIST
jgi:hypothetical protein